MTGHTKIQITNIQENDTKWELCKINSERGFFQPISKRRLDLKPKVVVKSLLYCLDNMNDDLDKGVLNNFLELDFLKILKFWLDQAQFLNKEYPAKPTFLLNRCNPKITLTLL